MEWMPTPGEPTPGGWRRSTPQCKTWQQGGLDMNKPSPNPFSSRSSYQRLLTEVASKRGVFAEKNWDGTKIESPYCPPWRQTMTDLYGADAVAKIKAPVENYDARVTRFVEEERQRRLGC